MVCTVPFTLSLPPHFLSSTHVHSDMKRYPVDVPREPYISILTSSRLAIGETPVCRAPVLEKCAGRVRIRRGEGRPVTSADKDDTCSPPRSSFFVTKFDHVSLFPTNTFLRAIGGQLLLPVLVILISTSSLSLFPSISQIDRPRPVICVLDIVLRLRFFFPTLPRTLFLSRRR